MTSKQGQNSGYEISDPSQLPTSPTVSVLMLAYNHEPYVRQAIDSILEQEVDFPFEIVIGEDCSTDKTRKILLEYQALHPSLFRIITSDANVGMSENFKRTSEACRGKYIAICEADDYWIDSSKLSLQLGIAVNNPGVSLIVHNAIVEPTGKPRHLMAARRKDATFGVADVLKTQGQFAATASYFMRRDVISSLPCWLADAPVIDFFIEAYSQRVGSGYFISRAMSVYRVGQAGGWTHSVFNDFSRFNRFKSNMIYCYQRMMSDFPAQQHYLNARAEKSSADILFSCAALGKVHYWSCLESDSCKYLSKLDLLIAHIGPIFFRAWCRTRSLGNRVFAWVGIGLA